MPRFKRGEKVLLLDSYDEEMQGEISLILRRQSSRTLPALYYLVIINQYISVYAIDNKDRPCKYSTDFPFYRIYKFEEIGEA